MKNIKKEVKKKQLKKTKKIKEVEELFNDLEFSCDCSTCPRKCK